MANEHAVRADHSGRSGAPLRGVVAAPGRAIGPARIARTPSDLARLRPGEVLVVPTAELRWLDRLGGVAAVVTDVGGGLSRGGAAVRRAGRPAVFGTERATELLIDGMLVEVDGGAGVVRVLGRAGG